MAETDVRIKRAKFNEQAERYRDMAAAMKAYIEDKGEMNDDTRNLLSVAYKNVVGALRSSLRIVNSSNRNKETPANIPYQNVLENELSECCKEILDVIDEYLIPSVQDTEEHEAKVFYAKMKGDYYRYLAEAFKEKDNTESKENSEKAYKAAQEAAEKLDDTNPIKLGLALNFSVFYYEIKNEQDKACQLAKKAFDDAIAQLDNLKEDRYKDSTLIMQLLRDNLTLWTSSDGEENEEEQG